MSNTFFHLMAAVVLACAAQGQIRHDHSSARSHLTADFKRLELIRGPYREEMEKQLGHLLGKRIGVWASEDADTSGVPGWEDVRTLYLNISDGTRVELWLETSNGTCSAASGGTGGFLTDLSIFIGPQTNGFCFAYTVFSNRLYTLFSPGGLQRRMTFTKMADKDALPLPVRTAPVLRTSPNRFPVPTITSERLNRFKTMRGCYMSVSALSEVWRQKGVERLYLRINGYDNLFYLYKKEGKICLDPALSPCPSVIDGYYSDRYAYSFDGEDRIVLTELPPFVSEFDELLLHATTNGSSRANIQKRIEKQSAVDHVRLAAWANREKNEGRIVFVRIPDPSIPFEDFSLAADYSVDIHGPTRWDDGLDRFYRKYAAEMRLDRNYGVEFRFSKSAETEWKKLGYGDDGLDRCRNRMYYDYMFTNGIPVSHR